MASTGILKLMVHVEDHNLASLNPVMFFTLIGKENEEVARLEKELEAIRNRSKASDVAANDAVKFAAAA